MTQPSAHGRLLEQSRHRADRLARQTADALAHYVGLVVRNNPSRPAEAVLYRPDVLRALDEQLSTLHRHTADLASASYQAGMRLARSTTHRQITDQGYEAPTVELWPSPYLDAVLADLDRAADRTKTAVLHLASEAYRGVATPTEVPNVPAALGRLRALAVAAAIQRALDSWSRSARAAVSVLATRGRTEITLDAYTAFAQEHSGLRLAKQWRTTSADPCATCRHLNGTILPLQWQFDHRSIGSTPPVYRDLLGPPRHPMCVCELVLVVVPAATLQPAAV